MVWWKTSERGNEAARLSRQAASGGRLVKQSKNMQFMFVQQGLRCDRNEYNYVQIVIITSLKIVL